MERNSKCEVGVGYMMPKGRSGAEMEQGFLFFLFSFIRLSVGTGAAPNSRCVHFLADVFVYHGSSSLVR